MIEPNKKLQARGGDMGELIAGRTLAEWKEFARRDDCLDCMVPSDLRLILAALEPAPDLAELVEALRANLIFAEKIADAADIDPNETALNVRVMPEGREVASRTWAEVIAQGHAALAKIKEPQT